MGLSPISGEEDYSENEEREPSVRTNSPKEDAPESQLMKYCQQKDEAIRKFTSKQPISGSDSDFENLQVFD